MGRRASRQRAHRLLAEAARHVGPDVVVISSGLTGDGYLATSIPTRSAADLETAIKLTNEALKKLRRWQRRLRHQERADTDWEKANAAAEAHT